MAQGARREAGNLAHGLGTSLAILTDEAATLPTGEADASGLVALSRLPMSAP